MFNALHPKFSRRCYDSHLHVVDGSPELFPHNACMALIYVSSLLHHAQVCAKCKVFASSSKKKLGLESYSLSIIFGAHTGV